MWRRESTGIACRRVLGDLRAVTQEAAELELNSEANLGQALADLGKNLEQERLDLVAKTIEGSKREAAQLLAEQEAENRKKIAEAERKAAEMVGEETAAKILADATAIKAEIDAAKLVREAAEAKAQLVREFNADLPEVKRYLAAFLADGRKLRDSGNGPASLAFLSRAGALINNDKGLEELLSLGAYYNDRPAGSLPEFFYFNSVNLQNKNDKIGIIEKAQGFLLKYGDLMVEQGLLAK